MNPTTHTLLVFTNNSPGVLQRITIVFTRRKLNIESLTVSETEQHARSRFTISVRCDKEIAEKVAKQIKRIVDVQDVILCSDREVCFREIALYKLRRVSESERELLNSILSEYEARIVLETDSGIMIEKAGVEDESQLLLGALKPLGVKEFVRSGRIALLKGDWVPELEQTAHQVHATQEEADSWL